MASNKKRKHKSSFCKRLDCYYNDGKFNCTTGGKEETKKSECIYFTKDDQSDEED